VLAADDALWTGHTWATLVAGEKTIRSPLAFDAIAAWFLKLQPLADCLMLWQCMARARRATAPLPPAETRKSVIYQVPPQTVSGASASATVKKEGASAPTGLAQRPPTLPRWEGEAARVQ
jgi:hypothetical protein